VGGLLLAGCTGGSSSHSSSAPSQDPKAPIVVWTDSTRQPGFQQFQKTHPDVKMTIETYDPSSLLTKIQLFNRTGQGWPDVVFDPVPNDVAALASSLYNYTAPLDTAVPADVLQGFGTANDTCTVDGKLYCLKNDLAQTVLWYNKPLMARFGYQLPTTWDQYQQLGERVAKEHPGYIIGTAGFVFLYYDFLWSSGCPLQTVKGPDEVHIDVKDRSCTRVAGMLDPLLADGSVSREGPFDPDVVALGKAQKILMMPGASWYGDFVFKPTASYATPNGVLAAAPMPTWPGADKNYSGATGGGIYMVSSHSHNTAAAVQVAQWMATSDDYQTTAPTYPAYGPAAEAWAKRLSTDPFYASDPFPVLQAQAALINPTESVTRYPIEATVSGTVVAKIRSGGKVEDGFADLQSQLAALAQSVGYAVT
jgi:multiple sugar transport system substrate-binding protein